MSESKLLLVILLTLKADLERYQRNEATKYFLQLSGGICVFVQKYINVVFDCEHLRVHEQMKLCSNLKHKLRDMFLIWPDCRFDYVGNRDTTFPAVEPNDYFREWDLQQQWDNPKRLALLDYLITELRKEHE